MKNNTLVTKVLDDGIIKDLKDCYDVLAIAKSNMRDPANEHEYNVSKLEYELALADIERLQAIVSH